MQLYEDGSGTPWDRLFISGDIIPILIFSVFEVDDPADDLSACPQVFPILTQTPHRQSVSWFFRQRDPLYLFPSLFRFFPREAAPPVKENQKTKHSRGANNIILGIRFGQNILAGDEIDLYP